MPGRHVGSSAIHGSDNVQMVKHVIKTAIVWKSIQHSQHCWFGFHRLLLGCDLLLNRANVVTSFEQMRRETVASCAAWRPS
jgi:hypothetical protein